MSCVCDLILVSLCNLGTFVTAEDAFLGATVSHVNGAQLQFKLSPTYVLYMAVRFRLTKPQQQPPQERRATTNRLLDKICDVIHATIQVCTSVL